MRVPIGCLKVVDWDTMWVLNDKVHRREKQHVEMWSWLECDHDCEWFRDRKQGAVICEWCGQVMESILEDVFGNNIPLHNIKPASLYKCRHHFNECISQFLVSVCCVPDSVISSVHKVLLKEVLDKTVTKTDICCALRSMGQARQIENWVEVYCHITEMPYPAPPSHIIEAMTEMFSKIEVVFLKH